MSTLLMTASIVLAGFSVAIAWAKPMPFTVGCAVVTLLGFITSLARFATL